MLIEALASLKSYRAKGEDEPPKAAGATPRWISMAGIAMFHPLLTARKTARENEPQAGGCIRPRPSIERNHSQSRRIAGSHDNIETTRALPQKTDGGQEPQTREQRKH